MYSFEEGHKTRAFDNGLDLEEDDELFFLRGDDEADYKEAINSIKFSRISPYKDGVREGEKNE